MEPITTLSGFLLSRFLHGIRIILLAATSCLFICHTAIAYNIKNKAPSHEDAGADNLRGIHSPINETPCIAPDYSIQTSVFESPVLKKNNISNYNTYSQNYDQPKASSVKNEFNIPYTTTQAGTYTNGDAFELAAAKLQGYHIIDTVQKRVGASDAETKLFCNYYYDKLYVTAVNAFWKACENKQIVSDADIRKYALQKITEYISLFSEFRNIEKEFPSSLGEYSYHKSNSPLGICNPACDNIGFENGNLSAWDAYYAQNTSTTTAFNNSTPVGGACGSVQRAAYDPTTLDYQVALMSGTANDPVAGALIPVVCPTGGSYSCRIGDSTRNGAQMGILQQTFTVTSANANFIYMYAVVLENPNPIHQYYQQPYFNVQMIDQNGNPIPDCGNYSVVSGPGLPGYTGVYFAPDKDTVYCKPWTTVFVPLQAYIGQCITIKVTVSDCSLGGHFGYAYFDATCVAGIITSLPTLCSNVATLTASAPAGASSYSWTGPCIVGPTNQQSIKVSCPGIYKVAIASVMGASCADTIVDTVTGSQVPSASANQSVSDVSCSGGTNGSATASASGGLPPYAYSWLPSGGTNITATNLSAGTYSVIVTDAHGCADTASVNITQPLPVSITITATTNVSCNGGNNGGAGINVTGGTLPYKYSWVPSGGTNSSAGSLAAGTYTVIVTDANNCTGSTTLTISQPPVLASSASAIPVSCNGGNNGSASTIVTGGTPPYLYTWAPNGGYSTSANNLTSGIYTITATDANNCIITSTVSVVEPSVITTSSSSSSVSCYGGNNGSATVTANGGSSPYMYSWVPNGGSTSVATNISAGNYTVTITDAHNCKTTTTINVNQPAVLSSLPFSTNVSCNGGSNGTAKVIATGGVSPYSYSWTPNVSSTDSAKNLSAGTYTTLVTDARGCTTTATMLVTQPNLLTVSTGPAINVLCNGGNNGSTSVIANGGTAPYSYSWAPKGGTNSVATNLSAGTYTVTVTDAHNCPTITITTISQPTALNINVSALTNVSCYNGSNGSGAVNATGGTGPYTYVWSPNVSTSISATNLKAGIYTITVTDANKCSTNTTLTITQPTALTSKLVSTTNIKCYNGSNGDISISATGGSPGYTYTWAPNVSSTVNATGLNAGSYSITVTDANGCTSQVQAILKQPAPITIASTTQEPLCNGQQNGSATISVTGGTPSYKYIWSTVPQQISSTATNIGAGTYTIEIIDANGCTKQDTVIVKQPFPLMASIVNVTNPICYGDSSGSASVYVTGGTLPYSYLWWNTTPKQTTYDASKLSAGLYTVDILDAHNCPVSKQVIITQPTPVITQATAPDSVCSGTTVTITASGSGGNGTYSYAWSTGSGSIATQNVTPTNTTTYTVTAVDGNGCKGTPATVTINTWNLGPANVSVTPPQSVCYGDTVTLYANVTNSNSGNVNIHWSNGFNGSGPFKLVLPNDTTFTVNVTNQCGSSVNKTITVKVNPLPTIRIPVQTGASCGGTTFTYDDSLAANIGDNYMWNFGDGTTGNTNPISHSYTQSGTYTVSVTITSKTGCKNTSEAPANVTVYPTAKAHFIADPKVAPISEPTISFIDGSINTNSWAWNFGDGNSIPYSRERNTAHTYADTGSYIVHLFTNNPYGCADTAIDTVRIVPEFTFYVPNAFSPNGDGKNETFTGKGIGIIEYDMVIYDRWGMFLFETHDLYKGWDGTVNGGNKISQEDTYVYMIKLKDIFKKNHSYIGSVTLIK